MDQNHVDADSDPSLHFDACPDPTFYLDVDPVPHQSDENLRPLIYTASF